MAMAELKMCDVTKVFTAVRKALEAVDVYNRIDIFQNIMREMDLNDRDKYLAMKAYGFLMYTGLSDEVYDILGKERINTWIEQGSLSDDFHPFAHTNLDHWYDPIARKEYYEEYLANNSGLRRTGSIGVKLHPNFTLAEIEHTARNAQKD
jgi:hypothetical protein